MIRKTKIAIIGGGFIGCSIAISLSSEENSILLFEQNDSILKEASSKNQGRLHFGLFQFSDRKRAMNVYSNQLKFRKDFNDILIDEGNNYYIFAKKNKLVKPDLFFSNLTNWGIPLEVIEKSNLKFLNQTLIEKVFLSSEKIINHSLLKTTLKNKLEENKTNIFLNSKVDLITYDSSKKTFEIRSNGKLFFSDIIFCCCYSGINYLLKNSGIETVNYELEPTELFHLNLEEKYTHTGISIIDESFMSIMPYRSRENHSFTHYAISKAEQNNSKKSLVLSELRKYLDEKFKLTIDDSQYVKKVRINEERVLNNMLIDWDFDDFHILLPRYITDLYNMTDEIKNKKLYTTKYKR